MRGGSYHIIIVVLKRQNRLKVGTDKPKLKVRMQSVLEKKKTSWKATFWAGGERCIQTGKMLHLLAGSSRSSGQQLKKHGYRRLIAWPEDYWYTCRTKRPSAGRLRTGTSGPSYGGALPWKPWMSIRSETRNQWRVANASVMWPVAPNDGSVWVFEGLQSTATPFVGHDQVGVNVNAQITYGFYWSDCSALDRQWSSR